MTFFIFYITTARSFNFPSYLLLQLAVFKMYLRSSWQDPRLVFPIGEFENNEIRIDPVDTSKVSHIGFSFPFYDNSDNIRPVSPSS